jgi:hypothetical protein
MIDEDPAHHVRGDSEEVGAVLPLDPALIHQPQIGLVDQCSGRKGVVLTLTPEIAPGQPPQLAVDRLHQIRTRVLITAAPGDEQAGHVGIHRVLLRSAALVYTSTGRS